MKIFSVLCCAFPLLLAGCSCPFGACSAGSCSKPAAAPSVSGVEWTLEPASLSGVSKDSEKPENPVTLILENGGKYYGCAGVNRYFGRAEIKEGKIKFGPAGATMMAGPGLGYEQAYLKMLSGADSFRIDGGRLTLYAGKTPVAVFRTAEVQK